MYSKIVKYNSDFLFLYEAEKSNPNGDPDMENKPRMDYDTNTNLVSDARVKRNIREYLKNLENKVFVDTLGDNKVSTETMLNELIDETVKNNDEFSKFVDSSACEFKNKWNEITKINEEYKNYGALKKIHSDKIDKKDKEKTDKEKIQKLFPKVNNLFLQELIRQKLIDVRMFGGAFAVKGFSKTFTGPIQINWGYSLHPVEIMKSSSIVSIMNEDNSTFGKKYQLYYSLLAFHGTINKFQAKETGLKTKDVELFRKAIFESPSYKPTTSKGNQYGVAYIEIEYAEGFNNYLGDLRKYIECKPVDAKNSIRAFKDLSLDFSQLFDLIKKNETKIEKVYYYMKPKLKEQFIAKTSNKYYECIKSKFTDITDIKQETKETE